MVRLDGKAKLLSAFEEMYINSFALFIEPSNQISTAFASFPGWLYKWLRLKLLQIKAWLRRGSAITIYTVFYN